MGEIVKISAFKSGEGVLLHLPVGLGIKPGDEFELVKNGGKIELRPVVDSEQERADLAELIRRLSAIGPIGGDPNDGRIEFPDRPGLY